MPRDHLGQGHDEEPLGRSWKDHWRAQGGDPERRREVRQDKRAARRRIHKRRRKQARQDLRHWDGSEES